MRVLLVAGSYPPEPCGVGDYTEKLANVLGAVHGVRVGVMTTTVSGRKRENASLVELIDVVKQWTFSELPRLIGAIRCWKPDVVHIQYPTQGFFNRRLPPFLPLVLRLLGYCVVETWHEPPPHNHNRKAMIYFLLPFLGAAGLIFVRPSYLDFFSPSIRKWLDRLPNILIQNAAAVPVSRLDVFEKGILRNRYLDGYSRLLVFFGFINRNKGLDCIIDIAEHGVDRVVIAGKVGDEAYVEELMERAKNKGLDEAVSFTGYLAPEDAADLLAVADAVVLPFIDGGGCWNTSIHSAAVQGTFVITTGFERFGFDPERNVYTVRPNDIAMMRAAVCQLAGRKICINAGESGWQQIANAHEEFYRLCLLDRQGRR